MRYFIIKEINLGALTSFEVTDISHDLRLAKKKVREADEELLISQELE